MRCVAKQGFEVRAATARRDPGPPQSCSEPVAEPTAAFCLNSDDTSQVVLLKWEAYFLSSLSRLPWIDVRKLLRPGEVMVGVAGLSRDSLSPLFTGMLDSRSQASGLCVSSSNGTVSSGDDCELMLMKPMISIESRRTNREKVQETIQGGQARTARNSFSCGPP